MMSAARAERDVPIAPGSPERSHRLRGAAAGRWCHTGPAEQWDLYHEFDASTVSLSEVPMRFMREEASNKLPVVNNKRQGI